MIGHNKRNNHSNDIVIGSIVTKEVAEEVNRQWEVKPSIVPINPQRITFVNCIWTKNGILQHPTTRTTFLGDHYALFLLHLAAGRKSLRVNLQRVWPKFHCWKY
jgi:hypothetical protein